MALPKITEENEIRFSNYIYIEIIKNLYKRKILTVLYDEDEQLQCSTGPAIIFENSNPEYWLHGVHYDFDKWCEKTNKSHAEKCELVLTYG